jgi:hypothetical protein
MNQTIRKTGTPLFPVNATSSWYCHTVHTRPLRYIFFLPSLPFPSPASFHNNITSFFSNLVSTVALLLLNGLLEPVLLHGRRAGLSLALDLGDLALVGLELAGNVGLLGGWGSGGDAELLHLALGVRGLDGGRFVGFQLLEVQVLDDVGWMDGRDWVLVF